LKQADNEQISPEDGVDDPEEIWVERLLKEDLLPAPVAASELDSPVVIRGLIDRRRITQRMGLRVFIDRPATQSRGDR
jgi:hypothetical protein